MLPSVVSRELQLSIHDYLRAAFPVTTPFFQRDAGGGEDPFALIDDLITQEGALFKGPYLDIRLPFRLAESGELPLRHVSLPYRPYRHQALAFERLCADPPRSTLIATGTGSGKTECFLLPLLDDSRERRAPGIKAIVIYPMNALAGDQARRFAKEVAKLDAQLSVGLFVGQDDSAQVEETMGPDHVITCQHTLRENPPDILLTNYKMLDFLLMRPKDQPLWRYNTPGMLRYLVVDELHTFDGAQGTDLACLIRRLRYRLQAGDELACVGTSATIGSHYRALLDYAGEIFASSFDDDAVIAEDRLSAAEYLENFPLEDSERIRYFHWPDQHEQRLDPDRYERADDYLYHQARLWFEGERTDRLPALNSHDPRRRAEAAVQLGRMLHQHQAFHELLRSLEGLRNADELAQSWRQHHGLTHEQAVMRLVSLVSLVSAARLWRSPDDSDADKWCQPLLQVRQQLWLRELRRLVCRLPDSPEKRPAIVFHDDLAARPEQFHLPLLHCRECHLTAWGAVARHADPHLDAELQRFYQTWFGHDPMARLLIPLRPEETDHHDAQKLCPACGRLHPVNASGEQCLSCGHRYLIPVRIPDQVRQMQREGEKVNRCHHDCPDCGARDSLVIMGSRAATLGSTLSGRLFSSPFNDHNKLIAFSDSVQDAAHRAGFFGANTWRAVLRQAMAQWLREQSMPLSLREMRELLPVYWRDRVGDDARFCGLFIAPNMLWMQDYVALQESNQLPHDSTLPSDVSRRLAWECIAEFGRRGQLGRSLERSGMAGVMPDMDHLVRASDALAARLREEVESLRDVDDHSILQFVLGWLHHFRLVGAVDDPELEGYYRNKGKEYILNVMSWHMPNYGYSHRPPAAITFKPLSQNFEALFRSTQATWSANWLAKVLGDSALLVSAEAEQIYTLLLKQLTSSHLLVEKETDGAGLWLLNPDRFLVQAGGARLVCEQCHHPVHVHPTVVTQYDAMPCLRHRCNGRLYAEDERLQGQRPAQLPTTDPCRIVAHEHTGLLKSEQRQAVEQSFMQGTAPWDINLLSATPTLEMGIDIGELSSVLLCSVPPAQANYLQRIGRAGRRDGNALAVTIAGGQNHDQFFFSEPLEMMVGEVQTPGVFLNAIAVLERQLVAFCFDRWVASGIDDSALPASMKKVLDTVQSKKLEQFPYNLIDFVGGQHDALLNAFVQLFEHLDDNARAHLRLFLTDHGEGRLSHYLTDRLQQVVEERLTLKQRVRQLKNELDKLDQAPDDEATRMQRQQLLQERTAYQELESSINRQQTLNFFTDEGMLPNYAFPEEGVTLRSVILRRREQAAREDDEGSRYEKISYSFQRSAQAALSELAPESVFYAISHQLEVEQVDLQLSSEETWRFCDRCQYSERVDTADLHSACPRCGSPKWQDVGQKHKVLRLRQVYATVDDRYSRITDESEQREPRFFQRQLLVDMQQADVTRAFRLRSDSLPFGFEFLKRVTLREVNFGPSGGEERVFTVAGQESSRKGFRLCRHCGKVQKDRFRRHEQPHAYTCPLRRDPDSAKPEDFLDSLYLYRELSSEAIRILLPLSEIAYSDINLHSFIAALNLGLKRHFRGDVQHLEVTEMREPGTADSGERIFLVLYDRVPGGTGYLKDLMRDPEVLMSVLEKAIQHLRSCTCHDLADKDGCYRCILAYRNSRQMPNISRDSAISLLEDILQRRDQLEVVEHLGNLSTNVLIESKLEQKFVDALAKLPDATLSQQLINGSKGSLLTLKHDDGTPMPWLVEHQVKVGPAQGVLLNTEIDVLLTPARAEDARRFRPIAVYLDGLQYHHNIVDQDMAKRAALLRSGRYWVFSLNWDDLPAPGQPVTGQAMDLMAMTGKLESVLNTQYGRIAEYLGWPSAMDIKGCHQRGAMDWLTALLHSPSLASEFMPQRAFYRAFTALCPDRGSDEALLHKLAYELQENAPAAVIDALNLAPGEAVPGGFMDALGNSPGLMEMTSALPVSVLKQNPPDNTLLAVIRLHLCFDDRGESLDDAFKAAWRNFWHCVNQLQFLPGFSMATRKAVDSGLADQVWAGWEPVDWMQPQTDTAADDDWHDIRTLSILDERIIDALQALGLPLPEVGVDLRDQSGAVMLGGEQVELCWLAQQVAIMADANEPLPVLPDWHLLVPDEQLSARLEVLKTQGVF